MSDSKPQIPVELIVHTIEQLEQIHLRATAASNAVDSVLGYLFNHDTALVPQFTLLKESLTHYRHLAEFVSPSARASLQQALKKARQSQKRRARRATSASPQRKRSERNP